QVARAPQAKAAPMPSDEWAISPAPSSVTTAPSVAMPIGGLPEAAAAAPEHNRQLASAPAVAMPIGGLPEAVSAHDEDPLLATLQLAQARHSVDETATVALNNTSVRISPAAAPRPAAPIRVAAAPRNTNDNLGNGVKLASNPARAADTVKVSYTAPVTKPAPAKTSASAPAPRAKDLFYTVQAGDTLYSIAQRNNISLDDLRQANKLSDNTIRVGQSLALIPAKAGKQGAQTAGTGQKKKSGGKLLGS
ncbi:MAG: LysM peptidoglycan-binding domain-containing protein, partial [Neisseriaceae bacterium]|nr:LysM peptidoglycan-binding domain-containing protein [Neisseriaceae bacterium]